jgi:spore maturation protein CgeB
MVSAPWSDSERLFNAGSDYLVARDGDEMQHCLTLLLKDAALRARLARAGRAAIMSRHTVSHRVSELLALHRELRFVASREPRALAAGNPMSQPAAAAPQERP